MTRRRMMQNHGFELVYDMSHILKNITPQDTGDWEKFEVPYGYYYPNNSVSIKDGSSILMGCQVALTPKKRRISKAKNCSISADTKVNVNWWPYFTFTLMNKKYAAQVKIGNNSALTDFPIRYWNGTSWILVNSVGEGMVDVFNTFELVLEKDAFAFFFNGEKVFENQAISPELLYPGHEENSITAASPTLNNWLITRIAYKEW